MKTNLLSESIHTFSFRWLSRKFWIYRFLKTNKYTAYDRFHGNRPYGKIPTKKEPIRTLGITSRPSCHIILWDTTYIVITGLYVFPISLFFDQLVLSRVACFYMVYGSHIIDRFSKHNATSNDDVTARGIVCTRLPVLLLTFSGQGRVTFATTFSVCSRRHHDALNFKTLLR